ncbi:hypothetical protein [Leclercia sp. UBA7405]|uniref:hypothetical protein n=1 Tax=Leclercia sp. UBA7405 TaxID=1946743 RepID=UPI00301A0EE7
MYQEKIIHLANCWQNVNNRATASVAEIPGIVSEEGVQPALYLHMKHSEKIFLPKAISAARLPGSQRLVYNQSLFTLLLH